MSQLPVLLFIPGSWHRPACYDKVISRLQDRYNLRCTSITLPSTTGDPNASFKDDYDAARNAISAETSQGRDVVVIAHSYGGLVGNSAVRGFTRPKNATRQVVGNKVKAGKGYVIGLILIASGFTFTGYTFMDPFLDHPPPAWRRNMETGFAELVCDPRHFFYHDLPAEEAAYWTSQLCTQSLKSLFEGREYSYAGWRDLPCWYIGTAEDQGLPVAMQRIQVGAAREVGTDVQHRELQTSHSPFLSQPDETTSIIAEAVQAFTGRNIMSGLALHNPKRITLPLFRLTQPATWLRFGLPLLFGHLLGKGFLLYKRIQRGIGYI